MPNYLVKSRADGFTLLEILVVVAIIAVVTGGALLSFGLVGSSDSAERDLTRLQTLMLDARDRAELENREYGVRLRSEGYQFLAFDSLTGRWLAVDDRVLGEADWTADFTVELDVDGRRILLDRKDTSDKNLIPDFGVDASGEFTSFELRLRSASPPKIWHLGVNNAGELALRETDKR